MFIQSQDDSQCCYSLFIKVVILNDEVKILQLLWT